MIDSLCERLPFLYERLAVLSKRPAACFLVIGWGCQSEWLCLFFVGCGVS